jgi:8-oxo-dGTP pyrophosphatase MutT (NUDIX family)
MSDRSEGKDDLGIKEDLNIDKPGVSQSPWITISQREVYRNPWLYLVEYSVRRPDGNPGIYGVVYPGDNAAIVALDAKDQVYLVGEFNFPLQRYEWMIPSGKVEDGEDPLATAKRELLEEVGIAANSWEPLGAYYLSSGISPQTTHVFLATDLYAGAPQPEGTERLQVEPRPLAQVFDACLHNEIRDAPSVLGIWRVWLQRAGRI